MQVYNAIVDATIQARLSGAILAAWIGCTSQPALADFSGTVVSIGDGDSLTVLVDRKQVKVRIADIDAPEAKQAFGTRSRQALATLCHQKHGQVINKGQDRYGRTIGVVSCTGRDAASEQVRAGMAWVFTRYAPKDSPLYLLEAEARADRRGLWADPHAVPPWEWRAERKVRETGAIAR